LETPQCLGGHEVHIHLLRVGLGLSQDQRADLLSLLPSGECEEYRRIGLESRQEEFLRSRSFLRGLLAFYLKKEMKDLKFDRMDHGKPFLKGFRLQFNLSHTEGLIACSFSHRTLGLDVEKADVRVRPYWKLLAGRHFSEAERDYLFSQPPASQPSVFFRIFTMKEAYLKALGCGLSFPPAGFSVPLPPANRSRLGPWEYFTLHLDSMDYCLTNIAESGGNPVLRYSLYEWDGEFLAGFLKNGYASLRDLSWMVDNAA
jgi:phosphopantetheinyl transferase